MIHNLVVPPHPFVLEVAASDPGIRAPALGQMVRETMAMVPRLARVKLLNDSDTFNAPAGPGEPNRVPVESADSESP